MKEHEKIEFTSLLLNAFHLIYAPLLRSFFFMSIKIVSRLELILYKNKQQRSGLLIL